MFRKALASATALLALPFLALGAQTRGGLTKVELLGLQQQMRDDGCGNKHAPGIWDEATRLAIRTCAKKYNTAADARALLQAMNIGFSPGEGLPPGSAEPMSHDMGGMNMSGDAMKMKTSRPRAGTRKGTAPRAGAEMRMKGESSMMMNDSAMMKMHERMMKTHDTTMMKMMRDSMMKSGDTAMMKMHESMMMKMKMHDSTMMKMSDTAMMKMHDSMMMKMKHDSTTKRDSTTIR